MKSFREYLEYGKINEARDKSVSSEFRIAFGMLQRMYNPKEVPSEKELIKDAQKMHLKLKRVCFGGMFWIAMYYCIILNLTEIILDVIVE